jgi:hypothetical protein
MNHSKIEEKKHIAEVKEKNDSRKRASLNKLGCSVY